MLNYAEPFWREELARAVENNESAQQLADRIHYTKNSVNAWASRLGVKLRVPEHRDHRTNKWDNICEIIIRDKLNKTQVLARWGEPWANVQTNLRLRGYRYNREGKLEPYTYKSRTHKEEVSADD